MSKRFNLGVGVWKKFSAHIRRLNICVDIKGHDIHNYKGRFESTLQKIKDSKEINDENKEIIFNFKDYLLSEGIGFAKI